MRFINILLFLLCISPLNAFESPANFSLAGRDAEGIISLEQASEEFHKNIIETTLSNIASRINPENQSDFVLELVKISRLLKNVSPEILSQLNGSDSHIEMINAIFSKTFERKSTLANSVMKEVIQSFSHINGTAIGAPPRERQTQFSKEQILTLNRPLAEGEYSYLKVPAGIRMILRSSGGPLIFTPTMAGLYELYSMNAAYIFVLEDSEEYLSWLKGAKDLDK
jgi:hypothetical protein